MGTMRSSGTCTITVSILKNQIIYVFVRKKTKGH